jgi:hypothetical protein
MLVLYRSETVRLVLYRSEASVHAASFQALELQQRVGAQQVLEVRVSQQQLELEVAQKDLARENLQIETMKLQPTKPPRLQAGVVLNTVRIIRCSC